jgi:non-ribosomal peptide synthetase component F
LSFIRGCYRYSHTYLAFISLQKTLSSISDFVKRFFEFRIHPKMSMPDKLSNGKAMTGEDCTESARLFWARLLKDSPAASFPHLPSPTYQLVCNASWEQYQISLVRRSQSPCTTATIIKAAWALLIGLHSNTNDVVTGMTLSGSGRTALVTIPFRAQFRRDQLVCDLLASIEGHANETKSFEYLSLSEIGQISPDAKIACDFRTLLLVRSREEMLPGNTIAQDDLPSIGCALALACELTSNSPSSTKVQIKATYDDSLLNKGQVQRILLQFEHIIQQVCLEAPSSRVSDVQSASAPDLEQILSWNATVPDSYEHCVHDLIVQRASMDRDQQAVCSWDGEFNYGELDDLSSELSSYLVAHASIGPEVLVPVCFEKSKWAVVAMLAVLKAGGACVPLSPTHPIARLKGIIKDLGQHCARTILTSASSQHLFEDMKSTLVVDASLLSTLSTDSASTLTDPSPTKPTPNNVAFVITTSGSTGKPKEIVLEHAAICTSARDHGKMIKLGPHSRVLQFAAYTFDISLSDMFVTLIHGGCICIPSEHDRMNNLAAAIQKFNANQVSITAAVVSHLNYQELKSLNVLVVAGEAMTREVVDRWAEHVKLINMYGPGEHPILRLVLSWEL